jgi:hypothetical protein
MAKYDFETPVELLDEVCRLFTPREMADYLYHNYHNYSLDLEWELDTFRLDNIYGGYDSYEEYEAANPSLFPDSK